MHIRPATAQDAATLEALPLDAARVRAEFVAGRMRCPWTWLAFDETDRPVGVALWWGRADSSRPLTLEVLHVEEHVAQRSAVAADLMLQAHRAFGGRAPEYQLTVAADWRDEPHDVEWRVAAAAAAGLTERLERFRVEWTPRSGHPRPSGRLLFRGGDDEEFLALFEQVAVGSLDVGTRRGVASMGPAAQARDDYEFYLACPGERGWWRVATTTDGEPVGFTVPSATPYSRNVGYLGVVPAQRGRGFVDDLLTEITRFHAAAGAERITATTDVSNRPMAQAFSRAGYGVTEVRLVLETPPEPS